MTEIQTKQPNNQTKQMIQTPIDIVLLSLALIATGINLIQAIWLNADRRKGNRRRRAWRRKRGVDLAYPLWVRCLPTEGERRQQQREGGN